MYRGNFRQEDEEKKEENDGACMYIRYTVFISYMNFYVSHVFLDVDT